MRPPVSVNTVALECAHVELGQAHTACAHGMRTLHAHRQCRHHVLPHVLPHVLSCSARNGVQHAATHAAAHAPLVQDCTPPPKPSHPHHCPRHLGIAQQRQGRRGRQAQGGPTGGQTARSSGHRQTDRQTNTGLVRAHAKDEAVDVARKRREARRCSPSQSLAAWLPLPHCPALLPSAASTSLCCPYLTLLPSLSPSAAFATSLLPPGSGCTHNSFTALLFLRTGTHGGTLAVAIGMPSCRHRPPFSSLSFRLLASASSQAGDGTH